MTDPRFDPAFQRGYDGPEPELVVRAPAASEAAGPAASLPTALEGPDAAAPSTPDPAPAPLPEAARPTVNGPRLALLLLGIALLLVSASMLYQQVSAPQGTSTTVQSQFLALLNGDLPPGLALAGFLCVIVWLALGALDRAPRHDGPASAATPERMTGTTTPAPRDGVG